jgi:hypothetical protein
VTHASKRKQCNVREASVETEEGMGKTAHCAQHTTVTCLNRTGKEHVVVLNG